MKSLLILIPSLFFTLNAIGQTLPDSGFTNKAEAKNLKVHGKKEGKWIKYLDIYMKDTIGPNAPFYMLTYYVGGKPYGIERRYYKSDRLQCETPYRNGKINGIEKGYFESGILEFENPYTNGKVNGVRKDYYQTGELYDEWPFKNNKSDGVEKEYLTNGQLYMETFYSNGKRITQIDITQKNGENVRYSSTYDTVKNYVLEDNRDLEEILLREGDSTGDYRIFIAQKKDIIIADSILNKYLLKDNLDIKDYVIQLMFVFDNKGNKSVFIVGLCMGIAKDIPIEDRKAYFFELDDGGRCYFISKLDLREKKVIELDYNGAG